MNRIYLDDSELESIKVGEAVTLTAIMAVLAIAVVAVAVYKIFTSSSSTVKIPGGWQFTWK